MERWLVAINLHTQPAEFSTVDLCVDLANGSFGSSMGRVKFGSGYVRVKWYFRSFQFGSGMVRFGSISSQPIFGKICSSCQNKQLCRKFWVGHRSNHVNLGFGSTLGWAYFRCWIGYGSGSFSSGFGSWVSFARSRFTIVFSWPKRSRHHPWVYGKTGMFWLLPSVV